MSWKRSSKTSYLRKKYTSLILELIDEGHVMYTVALLTYDLEIG